MSTLPTLQTGRLKLRPFVPSDAADVHSMAGDYRLAEMTLNIPHPYSEGMAEEWISTHHESWKSRDRATWAVCSNRDDELIGCVGLVITGTHYRSSLGYWIGYRHWKNGYCTEAATSVVNFGFEHLKLHRIEATHLTKNPASGAVMRKIGMRHEGTMHHYVFKNGKFEDVELFAILAQ